MTVLLPEHNNLSELIRAVLGALVYAFARRSYKKKGTKDSENSSDKK